MKHSKLIFLLSGAGIFLLFPAVTLAALGLDSSDTFVPNQVLIEFKPNLSHTTRSRIANTSESESMSELDATPGWGVAKLAAGVSVAQAITSYANNPNVASVQPNYIYKTTVTPLPVRDAQYGQQWAVKNTGQNISSGTYLTAIGGGTAGNDMNLEAAWNVQNDCRSVIVAVIDSGVNYNASDLAANMWDGGLSAPLHGWNFVGNGSNDPMDYNGHGTHVAGIIGAVGGNGLGITGVCWRANIMAIKAVDAAGNGTTSTIVQGIDFAIAHGAKIINMSLGGAGAYDPAFSNAIARAQAANVLVVVAAGNSRSDNDISPFYPCSFTQPNLICVAALDQNFALASFSNWGAKSVDVAAPGTNILSTWNGSHAIINDPLVAGPAGWVGSSTTAAKGGGWGNDLVDIGWLFNPASARWGSARYNAGTDDRIYKTFNLAGADAATLQIMSASNLRNGDFFRLNFSASGGDPFVSGTQLSAETNTTNLGFTTISPVYDIANCISATCSIGFQLTSTAQSITDIGVAIGALQIQTTTLASNSYNTLSGTSMAAPQVTGVAALVWAHNPLYTYVELANAIKNSGRSIPALAGRTTSGKAVDAMRALSYINQSGGVTVVVH